LEGKERRWDGERKRRGGNGVGGMGWESVVRWGKGREGEKGWSKEEGGQRMSVLMTGEMRND